MPAERVRVKVMSSLLAVITRKTRLPVVPYSGFD